MEPTDVHVRTLRRALEIIGSVEKLRESLDVPSLRLALWLDGRSAPPASVFLKTVDIVLGVTEPPAPTATVTGGLQVRAMGNAARCSKCDNIDFERVDPDGPVGYTDLVACVYCHHQVPYGDLIVALADEAAKRSAAYQAARARRLDKKRKREEPR